MHKLSQSGDRFTAVVLTNVSLWALPISLIMGLSSFAHGLTKIPVEPPAISTPAPIPLPLPKPIQAPQISYEPQILVAPQKVSFSLSGCEQIRDTNITWSFGDGTTAHGAFVDHIYHSAGSFTVKVSISNNKTVTTLTDVIKVNSPQDAIASFTYQEQTFAAPYKFNFDASNSHNPDGKPIGLYIWDFGDDKRLPIEFDKITTAPRNDDFLGQIGTFCNDLIGRFFNLSIYVSTHPLASHSFKAAGTYNVRLRVVDAHGNSASTSQSIAVSSDVAPTATFTDTLSPQGLIVSFDGSNSKSFDGGALTYHWNFGDQTNSTAATPSHIYSTAGTYIVSLTVTDDQNLSSTYSQSILVGHSPTAAISILSNTKKTAPFSVVFDASGSTDPQNSALTYSWSFGDNATGAGAQPTHLFAADGTYIVSVVATNQFGLSASTQTSLILKSTAPPVASYTFFSSTGGLPQTMVFNASASSSSTGSIKTYAWTFGDGSTGSGVTVSHIYSAVGSYQSNLTVTDQLGLKSSLSHTVQIANILVPVASFTTSARSGPAPFTVHFDGSASYDPSNLGINYSWDFADGSPQATTATVDHTFAQTGSYIVHLYITNADHVYGSTSRGIYATDATSPVPNVNVSSYSGYAPLTVTFDASQSLAGVGQITGFKWLFGDGSTGTDAVSAHTYLLPGSYTPQLILTNSNGEQNIWVGQNIVVGTDQANLVASWSPGNPVAGVPTKFDASASQVTSPSPYQFLWDFGDGSTATGVNPQHTYAVAGSYTVSLSVVFDSQYTSPALKNSIKVIPNVPLQANISAASINVPEAVFSNNSTLNLDPAPQTIQFNALSSPGSFADFSSAIWDFGDGAKGGGDQIAHN